MYPEQIDKLIATNYKLIALETDSPRQSINDFRSQAREGKAIYVWEKDLGLHRLEAEHITLPKTKTPEMVLNYINKSNLFGIYLLLGFNKDLIKPSLHAIMTQIASTPRQNKMIIFMDNDFNYPQKLMDKLLIVQESEVQKHEIV